MASLLEATKERNKSIDDTFGFMVSLPLELKSKQELKISWMGVMGNSKANLELKEENY